MYMNMHMYSVYEYVVSYVQAKFTEFNLGPGQLPSSDVKKRKTAEIDGKHIYC